MKNRKTVYPTYRHIVYNYIPEMDTIFFKQRTSICYIVSRDDRTTSPAYLSLDVRKFLEKIGFTITTIKRTYMSGINEICGINVKIDKIIENKKIEQISIRIYGLDNRDLNSKTQTIKEYIKSKCGTEPDVNTFTKMEKCGEMLNGGR